MNFTVMLDRSGYLKELIPALEQAQRLVDSHHVAFRHAGDSLVTERMLTAFRYIQDQQGVSRITQGMLLEAAFRSEKVGANSADITIRLALQLVRELTKSINAGTNLNRLRAELVDAVQRLRERLEHRVNLATPSELAATVEGAVKDHRLSQMVLESAHLAGLDGRIFPTHTGDYSIELVSGYTFEAASYPEFYDRSGRWKHEGVYVLVIDGVIDRESEVHVLLGEVIEKRVPLMIVARGYSEEVISTLAANRARGNLKVLPIRIPFEMDSVNLVTDIAIVCGANLITPMKGDTISTVRFGKLVEVDCITATASGALTITNRRTEIGVRQHAKMLQERRDKQNIAEMSEILNKRIRSLFSHCVHLRVGSKTEQQRLHELEAIDYGLRTIKSTLAHGVDNVSRIPDFVTHGMMEFVMALNAAWRDIDEMRPTMSIFSAIHHAVSVACIIASIECAVLLDDSSSGDSLNERL